MRGIGDLRPHRLAGQRPGDEDDAPVDAGHAGTAMGQAGDLAAQFPVRVGLSRH